MAFKGANGKRGLIWSAGREIARIGDWYANPTPAKNDDGLQIWTIAVAFTEVNDLWMGGPGRKDLRLVMGKYEWRWRDVSIERQGASATISAAGRPVSVPMRGIA